MEMEGEDTFDDSTATDSFLAQRETPIATKSLRMPEKKSSAKKSKKKAGRPPGGKGRTMVPSQGSQQGSQGEGGKKKKKIKREAFSMYLYKVLKQVHPDKGISTASMQIMNSMIADMMERISAESAKLLMLNKRNTLGSREVQTAVKLVLRGELGSHAVSEGTKAMATYERNRDK